MDLHKKKFFVIDVDGVLLLGDRPIAGAGQAVKNLRLRNKILFFMSNNSSYSRKEYARLLSRKLRTKIAPEEVISTSYATAMYLKEQKLKTFYALGANGLKSELRTHGLTESKRPEVIVTGLWKKFNYTELSLAVDAVRKGARFVATNDDRMIPTTKGLLPGAGATVGAVAAATGTRPEMVVGKPNPYMLNLLLKRHRMTPEATVVVGDRLDTDVLMGKVFGATTVLVLTGVVNRAELERAAVRPDMVVGSVSDLLT